MRNIRLGKTEIVVPSQGFGALPIQRVGIDQAVEILHRAYEGGIRFFDTARSYTDSEQKLGVAFKDIRKDIYIASKLPRFTPEDMERDLNTCLSNLQTDYIDLIQFHNPPFCPKPGDGTGTYEKMLEFKERGLVKHIGITNHRLGVAEEAINSGLYETLQFPFSYLAGDKELRLVKMCEEHDMGFIAMKGLAGGTITNGRAAAAFMAQYDNVLPIWGVQTMDQINEFLSYLENIPEMTPELTALIEKDRKELSGNFCRGCGYCAPCPQGISIHDCARMSLMLRRSVTKMWLSEENQAKMKKIENCINCGACKTRCPYGLDIPNLLKANYKDYQEVLAGKPL